LLASVVDGLKDGGSAVRILVEIADGLSEAVCAEPAIRSLKTRFGMRSEITVCSMHGDLYRNHPAVVRFGNIDPHLDQSKYGHCFRLDGRSLVDSQGENLMDHYAGQLGVVLMERRPWVCLDSFDIQRIQRFRLAELALPRIALAIGAEDTCGGWNRDGWIEFCRRFTATAGGGIVQIGESNWTCFDEGINLLGRLTGREAAAVLADCDLLICGDNGYLDVAAAVQTPVIALLKSQQIIHRMEASWGTGISLEPVSDAITNRSMDRFLQTVMTYCSSPKRSE
jgi:hypothetical protein